jgi:lysyl oxidase/PEP-CTERM motif-containing protein
VTLQLRFRRAVLCALWLPAVLASTSIASAADPLLPDLIPWESPFPKCYLHCGSIDNNWVHGKTLYRFNATTANIGPGPLEVRLVTHPDASQDIYQRIYDTEGGVTEQLIATFPDSFLLDTRKLYMLGFSQYNLRTVLPGNGVGPIVSSHDKISRAVVDSTPYDTSLPNAPDTRVYNNAAAETLGISVGWGDLYGLGLPGQWVEATGLSPGEYWLEMIVDPYNRILESNEANNTARILVDFDSVPNPLVQPGDYDRDNDVDAADYVLWRNTFGTIYPPPQKGGTGADGDGYHRVDDPDFDVWKSHFGIGILGSGSGATLSVPEPSTLALLLFVAIVFQRRRRTGV